MAFHDFYGQQADMYSFIYIPKFLMTERTFSGIQNISKIIYGFLMDRMKMSVKNQWIDDKGRVYLIYPMNELENDAGMSRKRIMECLQELKEAGEKDVPASEPFDEKKYQLKLLKEKALEAQKMLDEKNSSSESEGK